VVCAKSKPDPPKSVFFYERHEYVCCEESSGFQILPQNKFCGKTFFQV
jgi:hypothetical protein